MPDESNWKELYDVDGGDEKAKGLIRVPLGPLMEAPATAGARSLLYNEYIVYDVEQVRQKYLVRVKFNFAF